MINVWRVLLTVIVFLFIRKTDQVQDLSPSQQCEGVVDQLIDAENLRIVYKASILSALAYLEYEKNSRNHPWEVAFESTIPTLLNTVKFSLARRFCFTRSFFRRLKRYIYGVLSRVPLIGVYFNDRTSSDKKASNHLIDDECRSVGRHRDSIVLRWFFADWREGLWHDTEVLLGESETTAFVVFRGSDSAADLITNSQTLEPAIHSNYFGSQEGSIHRGMLNAYSRVDKGRLIALDRGDDKSAFGPHISDAFELFKNLKKSQNDADGQDRGPEKQESEHDGFVREKKGSPTAADDDDTDNSVIVSDTLLSNLLISSVLSALKAGKEVVLAGHSLGGSLALLLALDALVNHTYDSSDDDDAYSGDDMGENMHGSDRKEENDGNSDHSSRGSGSSSRSSNSNRDHTPPCRPNSGQNTASRTSTYRSTGYSHHNDKRCTGTAHISVLNKLHIVTFGQPELASPLFFESLKKQHTAAKKLLEERYTKVVSLSQAPKCQPDIVTQLVSKVGDVIGDWLLGSRKELNENIKQKISDCRKVRAETIKSTGKIIGIKEDGKTSKRNNNDPQVRVSSNSAIGRKSTKKDNKVRASASTRMVAEKAEKEKMELKQRKYRKEKNMKGYFGRIDSKKEKEKDEGKDKGKEKEKDIDKNKSNSKDRKKKSKEGGTGSKERSNKDDRDGSPRVIFVCSGASPDSIEAHCMNHYVIGLEHVGRTYNKKTKKSGSLSLKEKLKSKYLKNKAKENQRNDTSSSATKVLSVRAGGTSIDAGQEGNSNSDSQRNSKKSTPSPNMTDRTKQNSDTFTDESTVKNDYSVDLGGGIEMKGGRTPLKDDFSSSKLEFNSANKTKLMQKIKIKKKKSRARKHFEKGIHLATNLRLESALTLNLLSSERFLSMKADETIDFYTFV